MPELPDIALYLEHLERRTSGKRLLGIRLGNPFLVRSVEPPLREAAGRIVTSARRLGKRIVLGLEPDLFLVLHLMIAGRLHWKEPSGRPKDVWPPKLPGKRGLASFDFENGSLLLTEAGTKRRAWLRLVRGDAALAALDPGGLEPLTASLESFREALTRETHTVKRTLTDPRVFSGIGNAYSDEILHRARLSPFALTTKMSPEETARLHEAVRDTLQRWIAKLRGETGDAFPEKVTAFRDDMAVHGRFGKPCPDCAAPVQRIVYVGNETNYCAVCQTHGRRLADRALSRLLGEDFQRDMAKLGSAESLEELS